MTHTAKPKKEKPRVRRPQRSHPLWEPAEATDRFRKRFTKHPPKFQREALQYFLRYRGRGIEFLEHRRKKPEAAFLLRFLRSLEQHLLDEDRLQVEDCLEFQLLFARADALKHGCKRHP